MGTHHLTITATSVAFPDEATDFVIFVELQSPCVPTEKASWAPSDNLKYSMYVDGDMTQERDDTTPQTFLIDSPFDYTGLRSDCRYEYHIYSVAFDTSFENYSSVTPDYPN